MVADARAAAGVSTAGALLDVQDLHVSFNTADGTLHAVRGFSFSVGKGQTLGIVGESGSGKSVSAQALLGLVPGAEVSGHAWFEGHDLLAMSGEQLRAVRGRRISMVFQDPLTSLHPLYRVGWQIAEAMRAHGSVSREAANRRAVELLGMVGIPRPKERVNDYPHQFSGGMRQRVMIAMALALSPALIIADEPTTALDATVQAQVLELLVKLQGELGTSLILITPRPRCRRRPGGRGPGHAQRPARRGRRPQDGVLRGSSPVHPGAARVHSGGRRLRPTPADPRPAAEHAGDPAGLLLPPPLPVRDRPLRDRSAAVAQHRLAPPPPVRLLAARRGGR